MRVGKKPGQMQFTVILCSASVAASARVKLTTAPLLVLYGRVGMTVVRRRAAQAGLTPVGAQDLRRTAIYNLVEAGVNLAEVHQRFGFVSHLTLAVHYDHRDLTAQRRSMWSTTELHDLGFSVTSTSGGV